MFDQLLIGATAAVLALSSDEPGLRSEWLYNGLYRPVTVEVTPPDGSRTLALVLMSPEGNLHTEVVEVSSGPVDLGAVMPNIWRLRRTAYLQLTADDEPVGPALVVQPMLSRMVPRVEDSVNPAGIRYTRIVGWRDETLEEESPAGSDASRSAAGGDTPRAEIDQPEVVEDPWLANQVPGDRLFAGLRIYPERDVRLVTTHGDIVVAMRPDEAPNTVFNFLSLVEGGFYRGIAFHRVVPMTAQGDPFVIQAGDPTTGGSGGPGYWLPIERSRLPHDFGVISMARDVDPDSAGSQFFICLSRAGTARLDGHYCAFGVAAQGADTVRRIAAVELADVAAGRPVEPPLILTAELVPAPPRRLGEPRGVRSASEEALEIEPAAAPARVPR